MKSQPQNPEFDGKSASRSRILWKVSLNILKFMESQPQAPEFYRWKVSLKILNSMESQPKDPEFYRRSASKS